ncbi:APC family permease [Siminovitchia fortis]|uniref:APC family permease n=1 Tax=Siminovitchia fortis TaxID=254758 RepID=UPI001C92D043|nr:APC family permease [Siminovitchia fortis]
MGKNGGVTLKTPYFVIGIGIYLLIVAVLRFLGVSVSGVVIVLFSAVAALTSIADLFEILKYKKAQNASLIIAFLCFLTSLLFMFLSETIIFKYTTLLGDGFTILALGIVIGVFGIKDVKDLSKETSPKELKKYKFAITSNEYKEMNNINDIIERLKKIDEETLSYNRVHNGWAILVDTLTEHWNRWKGPFYDGLNRKYYFDFLTKLNHVAGEIGDIANPDYKGFHSRKIDMWDETIEITIQSAISNLYVPTIVDINEQMVEVLNEWDNFKRIITERYERERAEQ